jgi:hypothetical protein
MGFFENLNHSINVAAPLYFQNERWKEQAAESKRARDITLGTALLNAGNADAADVLFQQATGSKTPFGLVNSPANQLKLAQTQESLRQLEAKKNVAEELRAKMEGVPEFTSPEQKAALGQELGITAANLAPEEVLSGLQTGMLKKTPRDITLTDYTQALMRHDPEAGAALKALLQESTLATKEKELEMKQKLAEAVNEVRKYGYDQALLGRQYSADQALAAALARIAETNSRDADKDAVNRNAAIKTLEKMAFDAGAAPDITQQTLIRDFAKPLGYDYRPVPIKGIFRDSTEWRIVPLGGAAPAPGKAPAPAGKGGGKSSAAGYINKALGK